MVIILSDLNHPYSGANSTEPPAPSPRLWSCLTLTSTSASFDISAFHAPFPTDGHTQTNEGEIFEWESTRQDGKHEPNNLETCRAPQGAPIWGTVRFFLYEV